MMFVPRCLSRWVVSSSFYRTTESLALDFYDFCKPKLATRIWSNWHLICISLGLSVSYSRFESTPTTLFRISMKYKERLLDFSLDLRAQTASRDFERNTKNSFFPRNERSTMTICGRKLIKFNLQSPGFFAEFRVIIWFYWVPPIKFFSSCGRIITRLVRYETRRCYTSRSPEKHLGFFAGLSRSIKRQSQLI